MSRAWVVLLMTGVWTALFASADIRGIAFGALISGLIVALTARLGAEPAEPRSHPVRPRPAGLLVLTVIFAWELVRSALSVAREAWRPRVAVRPGIVEVPIDLASDLQITLLASLVSLTPGTLSLDVSPDGRHLYVHALVVDDDGSNLRATITKRFEDPVRRAFATRRSG